MNTTLETFYRDNYDQLCKRVRFRGCSPEDAEDVVQEAFVRALTYYKSFNEKRHELGAWFNTILNNALRDFKKAERMQGAVSRSEDGEEEVLLPNEVLDNCREMIQNTIRKANEEHQQILRLFYEFQYRPKDIANVMEVGHEAVRQVIHRFRKAVIEAYHASSSS